MNDGERWKLHAKYIGGILVGAILLLGAEVIVRDPIAAGRFQVAGTLASLVLAIFAIGYGVIQTPPLLRTLDSLQHSSEKISDAAKARDDQLDAAVASLTRSSEEIGKTSAEVHTVASEMRERVEPLSRLPEGMADVARKVEGMQSLIVAGSVGKARTAESGPKVVAGIPAAVNSTSLTGLLMLSTLARAKAKGLWVDLEKLPEYRRDYCQGFILGCDCSELVRVVEVREDRATIFEVKEAPEELGNIARALYERRVADEKDPDMAKAHAEFATEVELTLIPKEATPALPSTPEPSGA